MNEEGSREKIQKGANVIYNTKHFLILTQKDTETYRQTYGSVRVEVRLLD